MRKALLVLGVAVSMGWVGQAVAQTPNGFEEAVRMAREREEKERREEEWRKSSARNAEAAAAAAARGRRETAAINTWPVLPAARNPMFGKWMIEPSNRPKPKEDDLFGQLAQMSSLTCRLMFSDGIVNFKPGGWSLDDSAGDEELGPVTYRSNGNLIGVVPAKGINSLAFEVENKDRMVEVRTSAAQDPCVLIRVPQTTTYATRPRAPRPATAAATARPGAPAQAGPARPDMSTVPRAFGGTATGKPSLLPPNPSARGAAMRAAVDPRSLLGQGMALRNELEYQAAVAKLLEAARQTPNDARVHAMLADLYGRLSERALSKASEDRARQLDPTVFEIFN